MNIKRFRKSYNIKFIRVITIKDKNGDFIEFLLDLNCCIWRLIFGSEQDLLGDYAGKTICIGVLEIGIQRIFRILPGKRQSTLSGLPLTNCALVHRGISKIAFNKI